MADNEYYKGDGDGNLVTVPPIKKLCKALELKFTDQEVEIQRWKDKYKALAESDEEYKRLKKEAEDAKKNLYNGFGIGDSEKKKIDEWIDKHKPHPYTNAHWITYKFTPTHLGTIGEIECSCGEKFKFREL